MAPKLGVGNTLIKVIRDETLQIICKDFKMDWDNHQYDTSGFITFFKS